MGSAGQKAVFCSGFNLSPDPRGQPLFSTAHLHQQPLHVWLQQLVGLLQLQCMRQVLRQAGQAHRQKPYELRARATPGAVHAQILCSNVCCVQCLSMRISARLGAAKASRSCLLNNILSISFGPGMMSPVRVKHASYRCKPLLPHHVTYAPAVRGG